MLVTVTNQTSNIDQNVEHYEVLGLAVHVAKQVTGGGGGDGAVSLILGRDGVIL